MDKPHAIRLAEWLEQSDNSMDKLSAEELRRLHQVNQELVEALWNVMDKYVDRHDTDKDVVAARELIAKATGEQA